MTQCYGDDVSPESTAKEFLNAHKGAKTETSGHSSKIVVDLKANFLLQHCQREPKLGV